MSRRLRPLAAATAVFAAAPGLAQAPRTINIPAYEYPSDVEPGERPVRVHIRYELGDDGRFVRCEVARSSGQPSLDAATCRLLQERARFRPEPETRRGRLILNWGTGSASSANRAGGPIPVSLHDEVSDADYPAEALRRDEGGTVEYQVEVSETGVPLRCSIAQSSGSEALDRRTCQIVMERSAFIPASNGAGGRARASYRSRITWRIQE